jgi:hypothetical protein
LHAIQAELHRIYWIHKRKEFEMSSWVKAGLIGGAVVAVLNVLGQIPFVGCFTWILALVTYCCVGSLAAYWLPPVRKSGPAAKRGALAGLIATAIGTGIGVIAMVVKTAVFGPTPLPTGTPAEFQAMSGVAGAVVFGLFLFVASLVIAPLLGAIGGLVLAAIKSD